MSEQSLIVKITRPRLTGILPRARLFERLDQAGKQASVAWVSGPAGSGKTTLIASYLDARSLPCLWYSLDEGDGDIATFFYYLGLAAKNAAPESTGTLPLLTMEYLGGVPVFTRRFFEKLYISLKTPSVIVLDNYHHVASDSPFHEVIRGALSAVPEGITVIINSRSAPPPQLAMLVTYNKIRSLGWDDLKFDRGETGSLLSSLNESENGDLLARLHGMTTGWAAGLVLLTERLKSGLIDYNELDRFRPQEFFDYFSTELFDKTDQKTRDFLLKTSFLPQISASAAEELTGYGNASSLLAALNRNHFFTEQRSLKDPVYQYHPLFREFLQMRAKAAFSREELTGLLQTAAGILAQSGQIEDAIELYRAAGLWEGYARLILAKAQSMTAQGRTRLLEAWLRGLPDQIIENGPWLLYWLGVCRMPFALPEGRRHFEKAFTLFRERGDAAGVFLAWSGVAESIIQEMGDLSAMDPWISILDDLIQQYPVFPTPRIEGHVTSRIFMILSFRQRWHPAFDAWKEKAVALVHTAGAEPSLRLVTGFYLFIDFVQMGDISTCERLLSTMRRITGSYGEVSPLALCMEKMAEAWLAWATSSYERSVESMKEGLRIANESGVHLWDYSLLVMGVISQIGLGNLTEAEKLLAQMSPVLEHGRSIDKFYYYDLAAGMYLLTGDIPRAVSFSHLAHQMSMKIGFLGAQVRSGFLVIQVLRMTKRYREAMEQVTRCRETGLKMKSELIEFFCLLAEACLAYEEGDETKGLQALRGGMRLGRERGFAAVNYSFLLQQELSLLCVKALEADIEPAFTIEMIRRRSVVPDEPPQHIQNWPWFTRIYTLGWFELFRDGDQVRFTGKTQKKPLDFLKALIAFGGENVREEQVMNALWPDADGDMARISFRTTLHRLRQILGREDTIRVKDGRMSLDRRTCWVDVWAFERTVREMENRKNGNGASVLGLAGKAVSLYRGHFLEYDDDKSWTDSLKERLRTKHILAVTILGDHWLRRQEAVQPSSPVNRDARAAIKRAIEHYQKGLEIDTVAELFYQKLMVCHQRLGNHAEAVKVYQRCRSALSSALGVEPSEETERIYGQILGHST